MSENKSSKWTRALEVILGIGAVIVAFLILFYPGFGLATLIVMLSFGFMIAGLVLIFGVLVFTYFYSKNN